MFDLLRATLANVEDYELVVLDNELMRVGQSAPYAVKTHTRSAFRQRLHLPETAVYVHLFRSGGPHPHTMHVWKVPCDAAARSEARQNAALARALHDAPQRATRQMLRHFQQQFENVDVSQSVLRSMWDIA